MEMMKRVNVIIVTLGIITIFIAGISVHNGLRSQCVFCKTGSYIHDNLLESNIQLLFDSDFQLYDQNVNWKGYVNHIGQDLLTRAPPGIN